MFLGIKALHVIAVISWMAGLLYLPRLFVYHAQQPANSPTGAVFTIMESRLMKFIMRPAAVVTVLSGGYLIGTPGLVDWSMAWMPVKLVAVLGLLGAHGAMEVWAKKFARGENMHTQRFYRIVNEVPTLLMIAIVVMVIAKPF